MTTAWKIQSRLSFNVDNIAKSAALTNFSVEIKPFTLVGILCGHESWLLHYGQATRAYFDSKIFNTEIVPLCACPEHLDWQAEDKISVKLQETWIHRCTHMLPANTCASGESILPLLWVRFIPCNQLPGMSAHAAGERLLSASERARYCRTHPAGTQTRAGWNNAVKFPPNWEDIKEYRQSEEGKESITIIATVTGKGKELKLRQEKNSKPHKRKTQSLQACVKIVSDLFLFIKSAVKHPSALFSASLEFCYTWRSTLWHQQEEQLQL